jgi:phosphoglycolate phosphatase
MHFKAVIFDLDGTLLDTLEDIASATNRVLKEKSFPSHKLDAYRYFVGDGSKMLITRALPEDKRDEDTVFTCFKIFIKDYGQNWKINTKPYEGITEMLDVLKARGLKMSVLSNKPHEFTKRCVTEFLSNWSFDVVLGQRDKFPQKPDPASAIKIARQIDMLPSDFLFLGDTAIDMKTAIAAGMFPVGALWGFRPLKELQESGAGALIKKPIEILNLLD